MQTTITKRSALAAAANTDTTLMTPPVGQPLKVLAFHAVNEGAAQAAGQVFELRFGANVIAVVGFDSAAAPIGQTSKQAIISHEIIGDGVTALVARNLVALAAASDAAYVLVTDADYDDK
jgi:hypothetical protein